MSENVKLLIYTFRRVVRVVASSASFGRGFCVGHYGSGPEIVLSLSNV